MDHSSKIANGIVKSRTICCSKQGFKRKQLDGNVKRRCGSIKIGCTARILLKLGLDGMYIIAKHFLEHNHKCAPKKSYMFTSQRGVSDAQAFEGDLADSVGIRSKATYDLMSAQAGGSTNLGFFSVDYKNYLQSKRMKSMAQGDAGGVLQ